MSRRRGPALCSEMAVSMNNRPRAIAHARQAAGGAIRTLTESFAVFVAGGCLTLGVAAAWSAATAEAGEDQPRVLLQTDQPPPPPPEEQAEETRQPPAEPPQTQPADISVSTSPDGQVSQQEPPPAAQTCPADSSTPPEVERAEEGVQALPVTLEQELGQADAPTTIVEPGDSPEFSGPQTQPAMQVDQESPAPVSGAAEGSPLIEEPFPAPAGSVEPGAVAAGEAVAEPLPHAEVSDGPVFRVSQIELKYLRENPQLPNLDELMQVEVELGQTEGGLVAPRAGVPSVKVRLADLAGAPSDRFYASAVQKILERLRDELMRMRYLGVYVAPDPLDIDENGNDLRPQDRTALRVILTVGVVAEVRTVGAGERFGPTRSVNDPVHARIRKRSPLRPAPVVEGEDSAAAQDSDLLRKDVLDDYVFRLSRHPGRRVDVAISPSEELGGVVLDYLVTENKPWTVYAQVSNTGTEHTDKVRERFGFFHTQLTDHDDVLSIDYVTAGFDQVHAVMGSYEAPWWDSELLRWRVSGNYSEFTASDVGFFKEDFTGSSWGVGGELIANVFQKADLFVDLVVGARFWHVEVDNPMAMEHGQEDFFLPAVGLELEQETEWFSTHGVVRVEWESGATGVDREELGRLGRTVPGDGPPDDDWVVLSWDLSHSVFLEPLLNPRAWQNPASPKQLTLAHEVAAWFRGQYAFEYRLIPQAEQVVGGFYTVRGYPESVVAGDTVFLAGAEYRYHLPRAFRVEEEPRQVFGRPFRFAPQYPYGRPDWDLVFRGFIDFGHTHNDQGDVSTPEPDETLVGTGVGVEVTVKRNLSLRADWAVPLRDTDEKEVSSGDDRFHFSAIVLY